MNRLASRLLAALGLLVPCAVLFHPFLLRGEIPLNGDWLTARFWPWSIEAPGPRASNSELDDPATVHYPLREAAMRRLRQGELPLWNDGMLGGMPHLADNFSLPFTPFLPVYLFFQGPQAHAWTLFLQTFFAGAAMFAYLRGRNLSPPAAILGAWAFMLNGGLIPWMEHHFCVGAFLWLPVVFWGVDRIGEGRRRAGAFAVAMGHAAELLAGNLQFSIYFLFAAAVYAAVVLGPGGGRRRGAALSDLALAFGATILGAGLAGVQLLPTADLAAQAARSAGKYETGNFIRPLSLLAYIFGDLFGNPGRAPGYAGNPPLDLFGDSYLNLSIAYAGAAALPLAAAAGIARRSRAILAHALYALPPVAFYLLLGWPAFERVVRGLFPPVHTLHGPRMQILLAAALPALVAEGFDVWRQGIVPRRLAAGWGAAVALVAVGFVALPAAGSAPRAYVEFLSREFGSALFNPRVGIGLFLGFATAVFLWMRPAGPGALARTTAVWLVLALADLLYFATGYPPFTPRGRLFPETESIAALRRLLEKEGKPWRFAGLNPQGRPVRNPWKGDSLPPASNLAYGLPDVRGKAGLLPLRTQDFFSLLNATAWDPLPGEETVRFDTTVHFRTWRSPLLDLAGVRFFLTADALSGASDRSDASDGPRIRLVHDGRMKIYENLRALERVFPVREARVLPEAVEKVQLLSGILVDPKFDPRAVAYVDRALGDPAPGAAEDPGLPAGADILEWGPERLVFATTAPRSTVFVVGDAWDRDWRAVLDGGAEIPIARADYLFRAVRVPAGRHTVVMTYWPAAFSRGIGVSAASAALLALLLLAARPRAAP